MFGLPSFLVTLTEGVPRSRFEADAPDLLIFAPTPQFSFRILTLPYQYPL